MKKIFYLLILLILYACRKDALRPELKPLACFYFSPNTLLKIGDTIIFSNCSENSTSFYWDFGDGSNSTDEMPFHVFEKGGQNIVKLIVSKDNYSDSISKSISIEEIYISTEPSAFNDKVIYNLDIDKDNIIDISIKVSKSHGTYIPSIYCTEFSLMNGYEINVTDYIETTWSYQAGGVKVNEIDTILIPKILNINDTAKIDDVYSNSPIMLTYVFYPLGAYSDWSGIYRNIWISSDYRYIVFRRKSENENILAWLKVKVTGYSSIVLNSYKCYKNQDEVIIE